MNRQEIFTKVFTHFKNQQALAQGCYGICHYLMEDGRKCAIGCLIPDSLYFPEIEGLGIVSCLNPINWEEKKLVQIIKEVINPENNSDYDFLIELQDLHDRSREFAMFMYRLAEFGKARGFEFPAE